MTKKVFNNQLKLFARDKGLFIFYALFLIICGIIQPLLTKSFASSLPSAAFFTLTLVTHMLSDSVAGERERKTLETLLSAPIKGRSIVAGKFLFCMLFTLCFFGINAGLAALTDRIMDYNFQLSSGQFACILAITVLIFAAIVIAGVYFSAKSADTHTAGGKISVISFTLGFLLVAYATAVLIVPMIDTLIIGGVLALIALIIISVFAVKISRVKQSDYFQNISSRFSGKALNSKDIRFSGDKKKSQFGIVFRHELRLLLKQKMVCLNLAIMCGFVAVITFLGIYYTGKVDLNYSALFITLMIPRTTANLVSFSVGGEKVCKTGESLLSTPLRAAPMFLAKCGVSIFISAAMLVTSAILALISINIYGAVIGSGEFYMYSAAQIMLAVPVSLMSCVTMTFITGIMSVNAKTPRQGLYVASMVSFLFVLPPLAIVYLTNDSLLWAAGYCVLLFAANAFCVKAISGNISRPGIMSRL